MPKAWIHLFLSEASDLYQRLCRADGLQEHQGCAYRPMLSLVSMLLSSRTSLMLNNCDEIDKLMRRGVTCALKIKRSVLYCSFSWFVVTLLVCVMLCYNVVSWVHSKDKHDTDHMCSPAFLQGSNPTQQAMRIINGPDIFLQPSLWCQLKKSTCHLFNHRFLAQSPTSGTILEQWICGHMMRVHLQNLLTSA